VAYFTPPETKINRFAWNYGVWAIEKAGPTFVKLVQWATTRNDLFSTEFIQNFSKLQDNTMGHSWKDTIVLLEDSYGKNYMDIFEFDNVNDSLQLQEGKGKVMRSSANHNMHKGDAVSPIGSGCIAQVYKAKLKKDTTLLPKGSDVAIKVTHPNILHKVCVDFYILNKITRCMEAVPYLNLDYLSMRDSVEQFRDIMLPQLDLRVEASNLRRFRRDFADDPRIEFPQPIGDLTTEKVLVEAFVHGEPILNYCDEGRKPTKDREYLARLGFETVMKMVFLYDFVHGDLHPGMLQLLNGIML
jgi:aarF domain-containing kinase